MHHFFIPTCAQENWQDPTVVLTSGFLGVKKESFVIFVALEYCQSILQVLFWTKHAYECLTAASEMNMAEVTLACYHGGTVCFTEHCQPVSWRRWLKWVQRSHKETELLFKPCSEQAECWEVNSYCLWCILELSWAFWCCFGSRTSVFAIFCILIFFPSLCGYWKCLYHKDL